MQTLKRITDATTEPVTLGDVKASLILAGDLENALINGYITTARQLVEDFAHISLLPQTWQLSWLVEDFPSDGVIRLPRPPIQSVSCIRYVDDNGVLSSALDTDTYWCDVSNECIRLVEGEDWETANIAYYCTQYVAGYLTAAAVPYGFKSAIIEAAHALYENRTIPAVSNSLPDRRRFF